MEKNKESIKLDDFLNDVCKVYKGFAKLIKPETRTELVCPECKTSPNTKGHNNGQYCPRDGKKLKLKKFKIRSEEAKDEICRMFIDFENGLKLDDSFPYEFIESTEERGDGHGYDYEYIFRRKSDNKHFLYYTYNGRIESDELYEVEKTTRKINSWE